jgi:hypothetical protein
MLEGWDACSENHKLDRLHTRIDELTEEIRNRRRR